MKKNLKKDCRDEFKGFDTLMSDKDRDIYLRQRILDKAISHLNWKGAIMTFPYRDSKGRICYLEVSLKLKYKNVPRTNKQDEK